MCRKEKKILVEIYSQEEQIEMENFARNFSNQNFIWVGLTYRKDWGKVFQWDSSGALPMFSNWAEGYPKNNEIWRCVALFNGKWKNIDCENGSGNGVCQEGSRGSIYK